MQKVYTIFILFWLSVGSLWAQPESDLQIGIDRFRAGQRIWNAPVMETARAEFTAVARRAPGTYLPLYWQSVSEFYLLLCYGLEDSSGFDPKKAEGLLDRAEETMKAAIAARPQEAECHAMLSSVYGFRIMRHPFSAVWNGPKVLSLQSDALENELKSFVKAVLRREAPEVTGQMGRDALKIALNIMKQIRDTNSRFLR